MNAIAMETVASNVACVLKDPWPRPRQSTGKIGRTAKKVAAEKRWLGYSARVRERST